MELYNEEKELINNYIPTLKRNINKNISFKYFKSPFVENFMYKIICQYQDDKIISKIIDKINENVVSNEDITFSLKYYYNFNKSNSIHIQNFIFKTDEDDMLLLKFKTNTILFNIKYYQYYFIINELLYEDENSDKELFYAIYLFIKNDSSIMKKYFKKYFKMRIFFCLINDLFKIYEKNIDILKKNEIIQSFNPLKNFIKNIFLSWHETYKEYLDNNEFNNIQEEFMIKKSIFNKFMCNNNMCNN